MILEILKCIPVVIIFAFPRSKSGIFDLILEKISHSRTASHGEFKDVKIAYWRLSASKI